ncbi:MAG: hypothetical protein WKF84_01840 [Pyrinomonadaceae bacterium]
MKDAASIKVELKKDWPLTENAFGRLLGWLDDGVDSSGERYLETRRRLVAYFDRKNCLSPDDLADETLNRVARRLEEEGSITNTAPGRYCYIVAKFVFLEYLRGAERDQVSLDNMFGSYHPARNLAAAFEAETQDDKEKMLDCLERCLQNLEPDNRELIFRYYEGEQSGKIKNRRGLAAQLKLTVNALSIRACRIRSRLEACVSKCCGG